MLRVARLTTVPAGWITGSAIELRVEAADGDAGDAAACISWNGFDGR